MRSAFSTTKAKTGLLIAYDPDAIYPYWACWETGQLAARGVSQPPVGHGHTPEEAIDCLYALMAWWCLQQTSKPPLAASIQDHVS